MPAFWLPNPVAESILAEKAGMDEARRVLGVRQALKSIDSRLDLFLCTQEDPDNELRMGYWYVIRRNDNGTMAAWQVQTPEGKFREPDEQIVEAFRRMDKETIWDFKDERERRLRARKRSLERKREEAFERLKDEADYTFRVQHAFPSLPWKKDAE